MITTQAVIPSIGADTREFTLLKKGVWLYIVLWICEGALRKWVLPGLATPLLVVRDPVAIFLIATAIREDIFPLNIYTVGAVAVTLVSFVMTLIFGHGNLVVDIYGARIILLHFPVLFIIGRVLDFNDVLRFGTILVYLTPPMTVLMAMQFYSPQSAWVNRGIGGDLQGSGFSGAMGYFRPSGTFSFISGLTAFYSLCSGYIFFFWIKNHPPVKKWILAIATACLFASIPLSISRTLLFQFVLTILFVIVAVLHVPKYIPKLALAAIGALVMIYILSTLEAFQTAGEVFVSRFESANKVEKGLSGTLIDRFLGGMLDAVANEGGSSKFWGMGLGMGTNAGAKLMTGKTSFLIAEGEWGRMIGEMGLVLGLCLIMLRLGLALRLAFNSFLHLRGENFLPWFLISLTFVNIVQGQWAQPSALGFSIIGGGLIIASLKPKT